MTRLEKIVGRKLSGLQMIVDAATGFGRMTTAEQAEQILPPDCEIAFDQVRGIFRYEIKKVAPPPAPELKIEPETKPVEESAPKSRSRRRKRQTQKPESN